MIAWTWWNLKTDYCNSYELLVLRKDQADPDAWQASQLVVDQFTVKIPAEHKIAGLWVNVTSLERHVTALLRSALAGAHGEMLVGISLQTGKSLLETKRQVKSSPVKVYLSFLDQRWLIIARWSYRLSSDGFWRQNVVNIQLLEENSDVGVKKTWLSCLRNR